MNADFRDLARIFSKQRTETKRHNPEGENKKTKLLFVLHSDLRLLSSL